MLAGRYTLLEQDALTRFLPLCWEKGIGVVVGGPFNSGILATGPKADAHYNYRAAPDGREGAGAADPADLQGVQGQAAGGGAALSARTSRGRERHPGVSRASEARRNAAMMTTKIPPALWRTLKAEKLIREDAPTPK